MSHDRLIWGDNTMKHKNFGIIYALILGIVFPSLLIAFLKTDNQQNNVPATTLETSQETFESRKHMVSVLLDNGVVEDMELEDYVLGVVLREMPAEFEAEALKAQAVVARTYTLRRIAQGKKHEQADICTSPACCQGFYEIDQFLDAGEDEQMLLKVSNAVLGTAGQVLLYENELIEATYFSCSGGVTEDAIAVWGTDIPYLKSVNSPGEEGATHYTDKVTFTTKEFNDKLGGGFSGFPELWIESISYTQGAGVDQIQICGQTYTGVQLRNLLSLRSTAFSIHIVADTVTITTKGFGHRVGMSQYGAEAMAVQGACYEDILAHYYQGTVLTTFDE